MSTIATVRVTMRVSKRSQISFLVATMKADVAQMAHDFAQSVVTLARSFAPKRTGFLRSSIVKVQIGPGIWQVRVLAHYGVYVEYGTTKMMAQPFFRRSIAIARSQKRAA